MGSNYPLSSVNRLKKNQVFYVYFQLTAIHFLIILLDITEEETVEDADDNDGIDIEYQHWIDDEITTTMIMKIKKHKVIILNIDSYFH